MSELTEPRSLLGVPGVCLSARLCPQPLWRVPQTPRARGLPAPPRSRPPLLSTSLSLAPDAAPLLIGLCNLRDCYLLIDRSERSKVHYLKQEAERDPEEQMDAWKDQKKD